MEAVKVLDRDGLDDFRVHGDDAGRGTVVAPVRLAEPPEPELETDLYDLYKHSLYSCGFVVTHEAAFRLDGAEIFDIFISVTNSIYLHLKKICQAFKTACGNAPFHQ